MSEISEILKDMEGSDLNASLQRIESLLAQKDCPKPLHLGIQLALRIAQEMKEGKEPGAETAMLVSTWVERYGAERVDDAVAFARQFLLQPQEVRERIEKKVQSEGGLS